MEVTDENEIYMKHDTDSFHHYVVLDNSLGDSESHHVHDRIIC